MRSEFAERLNRAQIDPAQHVIAEGINYQPTPPLRCGAERVVVTGYLTLIGAAVLAVIDGGLRRQKESSVGVDEEVHDAE